MKIRLLLVCLTVSLCHADIHYSHPNNNIYSVKNYGATGDGTTNDTAAIQAAIDDATFSSVGRGIVYFPKGTYQFTNLTLPPAIILRGISCYHSSLRRITGSTGTAITDADNASKINIEDLQINGNDCTGDLIVLGYNTYAWSTLGCIRDCWIRNCTGYGIKVKTNVAYINRTEVTLCTSGSLFEGSLLIVNQFVDMSAASIGLDIEGEGGIYTNIHCEGDYSTTAIKVDDDNNIISNVSVTVDAEDTLPAVIKFGTSADGSQAFNIDAIFETGGGGGGITAVIVDDETGASYTGCAGASSNYYSVPYHRAGGDPYQFYNGVQIIDSPLIEDVNNISADISTFNTYGIHIIDSSGATITGTLADGSTVGQKVSFVCKTAGNNITITVSHHVTSDPEDIRLDAAKEWVTLVWDGTDWVECSGNGQTYP